MVGSGRYVKQALPLATVLGAPIGGYVPEVEFYEGPHSLVPTDDLRTPAFRRLVSLYNSHLDKNCVPAPPNIISESVSIYIQKELFERNGICPMFLTVNTHTKKLQRSEQEKRINEKPAMAQKIP